MCWWSKPQPVVVSAVEEQPKRKKQLESNEDKTISDAERRKAKGRKATILTSGQGVTEEAPIMRKTLLGR